ncbi:CcoQ/FixQ family Cbb3-type cytochrome c oxidase assembly chaperone [Thiohalophilus sp.]|uniref:CcoQ/FixQ family Cbb3-type cytochrome c oxidase assembly chaperone n=1 Tax=Thiohalophilus sp. TaxID=3028392 RepID=UPI003A102701
MAYDVTTYIWLIGIPIIFIGIVVYVYRPGARKRYKQDAKIPVNQAGETRQNSSPGKEEK